MPPSVPEVGPGSPVPVAPKGLMASLMRLLERRLDQDGTAAPIGAPLPRDVAAEPVVPGTGGRRDRRLNLPREILDRSLSGKVLHGWLQNRHQTLVPLTFRLGRLDADDAGLVMRFAAVALLNASAADEAAQRSLERWLGENGADAAALAVFRRAIEAPEPLSPLIAAVRERELGPLAYAAAVVAADTRGLAGGLFANFIAARLALPADAVRSVDRRYRR